MFLPVVFVLHMMLIAAGYLLGAMSLLPPLYAAPARPNMLVRVLPVQCSLACTGAS
jgi:hypothetical protein